MCSYLVGYPSFLPIGVVVTVLTVSPVILSSRFQWVQGSSGGVRAMVPIAQLSLKSLDTPGSCLGLAYLLPEVARAFLASIFSFSKANFKFDGDCKRGCYMRQELFKI